MNIIDIILVILLVISVFNGYRKGFVHEFTALAALFIGIYAAFHFSDVTAAFINEFLGVGGKYLKIIAFILTVVLVIVLVSIVGKIFEKVLETIMLGLLNSLAGAVFGLVKGILMLSLLIMFLGYLKVEDKLISPEKQKEARFYDDIKSFAPYVFHRFDIDEKINDLEIWEKEEEKKTNPVI